MIWGLRKKYDPNDPVQLALFDILGEAAVLELTVEGLDDASSRVGLFLMGHGWSRRESQQRMDAVLAATAGHLEPAVHERAKLVAARALNLEFD